MITPFSWFSTGGSHDSTIVFDDRTVKVTVGASAGAVQYGKLIRTGDAMQISYVNKFYGENYDFCGATIKI